MIHKQSLARARVSDRQWVELAKVQQPFADLNSNGADAIGEPSFGVLDSPCDEPCLWAHKRRGIVASRHQG
jgi:hypothetical protein